MSDYPNEASGNLFSHAMAVLYKPRCLVVRDAQASCAICADACPVQALSIRSSVNKGSAPYDFIAPTNEAGPLIDVELCLRCGACVTSCPTNALLPQPPTDDETLLAKTMQAAKNAQRCSLLSPRAATRKPQDQSAKAEIVANDEPPFFPSYPSKNGCSEHQVSKLVECCNADEQSRENKARAVVSFVCEPMAKAVHLHKEGIVCLPCLAWIDEALLIQAAFYGAQEILMPLKSCGNCKLVAGTARVHAVLNNAQRICKAWCIPTVFRVVSQSDLEGLVAIPANATEDVSRRNLLSQAGSSLIDIAKKQTTSRLEASTGTGIHDNFNPEPDTRRWRLLDNLHTLHERPNVIPRILSPRINIEVKYCTGCAQCALFCPTEALHKAGRISRGRTLLEFDPARCRDCGICEEMCRYGALSRTENLSSSELFSLEPLSITIPKRRVLPTRKFLNASNRANHKRD